MQPLDRWIERQYRHSATAMLRSVSPVGIVKTRPGFGQSVRPRKGSIVASPVLAAYDPAPDYFFHWYRDSALVVDALRLLAEDEYAGIDATSCFADFVEFSIGLNSLDGRAITATLWRIRIPEDFVQFLRADSELESLHGDAVAADTRVNPDGTLDVSRWPRPQYDGPALRALTVLRWMDRERLAGAAVAPATALLRSDLEFVRRHWREPCFDIWEEELGRHYYTLRVAAAALEDGAGWLQQCGEPSAARTCRAEARAILQILDTYWLEPEGHYRSRILDSGARSSKELDIAVILAAIHAQGTGSVHSVHDPRMHATLARLEELFDASYPINRSRGLERGPAMGRYANDRYYSGGAYYFSTLGAAEFYFRASIGATDSANLFNRADAFLDTVRAFTPQSGDLSEQFDQSTGEQRSAPHLAWSYAAFISCIAARNQALRHLSRCDPPRRDLPHLD
jgi:glucoamylase